MSNWTPKYLHKVGHHASWLDHRVIPEAAAMFAAMISRSPRGGIAARYRQVVEKIAKELWGERLGSHAHEWPETFKESRRRAPKTRMPPWEDAQDHSWRNPRLAILKEAEEKLCTYADGKLHPVIQGFFDKFVGNYGHGSIKELTGRPVVFIEHISWWFAYLTFSNPLVKGQEMSTRAVWRRDWPIANDVMTSWGESPMMGQEVGTLDGNIGNMHKLGLEIARHEVEAWKVEFRKKCPVEECIEGKRWDRRHIPPSRDLDDPGPPPPDCEECQGTGMKHPSFDPQKGAFRPAFDRARWALPGTIETGVAHTADVRVMGRVLRVMEDLATASGQQSALRIIEEVKEAYRQAMPGMAGMWLREAVHDDKTAHQSERDLVQLVEDTLRSPHLRQVGEALAERLEEEIGGDPMTEQMFKGNPELTEDETLAGDHRDRLRAERIEQAEDERIVERVEIPEEVEQAAERISEIVTPQDEGAEEIEAVLLEADKPTANGNVYTEEALRKAAEHAAELASTPLKPTKHFLPADLWDDMVALQACERLPGHLNMIGPDRYSEDSRDVHLRLDVLDDDVKLRRSHALTRQSRRSYADPYFNDYGRVTIDLRCSLACTRDWNRHRVFYPWQLRVVRDALLPPDIEPEKESPTHGFLKIDHHYGPISDFGKEHVDEYLRLCTKLHEKYMSEDNQWMAMLCLPFGTRMHMRGQGGIRDATYMTELRGYVAGGNFEYREQARTMLDKMQDKLRQVSADAHGRLLFGEDPAGDD